MQSDPLFQWRTTRRVLWAVLNQGAERASSRYDAQRGAERCSADPARDLRLPWLRSKIAASAALLGLLGVSGLARANLIQDENARPGSSSWLVEQTTGRSIEGYASEVSALPGETLHFHVGTEPAARYRIEIYRLGWYAGAGARLVACRPACESDEAGQPQPVPPPDASTGEVRAGWPVTDVLTVPEDWVSGYYVARLVLTSGNEAGKAGTVRFVVRSPVTPRSAVLVQVPVNTWQAYNDWGGKSLYNFNSVGDTPANRVSFDRPFGGPPSGSQAGVDIELPLVRFLEREGYDLSYQTDVDTHRDPSTLLAHRLVVTAGHGEYWTKEMRDAFEAARAAGTNLAFMGANTGYWQVRYENGERTMVGYKSLADPEPDPALKTTLFRVLGRYECALLGVQHEGALAGSEPPPDYSVNPAALGDPWFAGTGFTAASVLPHLVGTEWDSIPSFLPPQCGMLEPTVLFQYLGEPGNAHAVKYVSGSGARIFSTGSLFFSLALDDLGASPFVSPDPRLQQFVRNVLTDLTRPAPPRRLDARAHRGRVVLRLLRRLDPRVQDVLVLRHAGSAPFLPSDPAATRVCEIPTTPTTAQRIPCADRALRGHRTYRYAALAVDEWGTSAPLLSGKVDVADSPPLVHLGGPRRAIVGASVAYVVTAHDPDGDHPRYRWRVDGKGQRAGRRLLRLRFRTPGRHHVRVKVGDGHGSTVVVTLGVMVRPAA